MDGLLDHPSGGVPFWSLGEFNPAGMDAMMAAMKPMGLPEAVYLHLHHSERTFTIETPSEFSLNQRVRAHVAIIEECVRRIFGAGKQEGRKRLEK